MVRSKDRKIHGNFVQQIKVRWIRIGNKKLAISAQFYLIQHECTLVQYSPVHEMNLLPHRICMLEWLCWPFLKWVLLSFCCWYCDWTWAQSTQRRPVSRKSEFYRISTCRRLWRESLSPNVHGNNMHKDPWVNVCTYRAYCTRLCESRWKIHGKARVHLFRFFKRIHIKDRKCVLVVNYQSSRIFQFLIAYKTKNMYIVKVK